MPVEKRGQQIIWTQQTKIGEYSRTINLEGNPNFDQDVANIAFDLKQLGVDPWYIKPDINDMWLLLKETHPSLAEKLREVIRPYFGY